MEPGKRALGVRCFSRSELFFMDHFPSYPIVPGVLQIEMIAQLGGKCVMAANKDILPVLTSIKSAKFRKAIQPGDKVFIHVDVMVRKSYSVASGWIEVDGHNVASAEVMYGHIPIPEAQKKDDLPGNYSGQGTIIDGI
ncbi:MAG: 3-hydroxyacyl-[acyl-carrier-protein] dehydratase FabZ [Chlorobiaceae bacterium]|nr:3-hydroxyacyl-[acyl-carrier-protein] dehydratase FabZ [Chlorobiaceae bacterium]NTV60401.1 3-hydroxyacyl-[acyl-carrier-protein] dehydratase FabZ [Chlorobiaceae bacterium]